MAPRIRQGERGGAGIREGAPLQSCALIGSFWRWSLVAGLILLLALHLWWRPRIAAQPPAIPFPDFSRVYVAGYQARIEHDLMWFDLFGSARRLRESDVLLLGTSHTMFGLSAAQLSQELTASAQRPVRVFNLGFGWADGEGFAIGVLRRNRITDKAIILDLCSPIGDGLSEAAQKVVRSSLLQGYLQVFDVWTQFLSDWTRDSLVPQFHLITEASPRHASWAVPRRFLSTVDLKFWANDDAYEIWEPVRGLVYREDFSGGPSHPMASGTIFDPPETGGAALSAKIDAEFHELHLRPFLTLIPYPGYRLDAALRIAGATGHPFIPIPPEGLPFFDSHHLTPEGRRLATRRLFEGLQADGLGPPGPTAP